MKTKFIILTLFISFLSYCQVNIEPRDLVNQHDYTFTLMVNNSSMVISRYKSSTINEISLILKTETEFCNGIHGISLILFSGEKLIFENTMIACDELETKKYMLTGSLLLTSELYNKLSQTEIIEFELGGVIVPVNFKEKGENLRALFKFSEDN